MKSKILKCVLGILIGFILTGCATESDFSNQQEKTQDSFLMINNQEYINFSLHAEKAYNFFFVGHTLDNPYWDMVKDGIAKADRYYGVHTETIGTNDFDEDIRFEYLKQAVACRPDGIITPMFENEEYLDYVDEVIEKGIPIIFVNSNVPISNDENQEVNTNRIIVGISDYEAGYLAGQVLIEVMGGQAKIGVLSGGDINTEIYGRMEGFCDAINQESGMEICMMGVSHGSLDIGIQVMDNMLNNHDLDAVFGTCATDAIAAVQVLKNRSEDITVIGFDNLDATLQYIEDEKIYATIMQNPDCIGWMGIQLLIQSIQEPENLPQTVNVGTTLITKENVEKYMKD